MLISRKRRFIFIHVYKNAGISVTSALAPFAAGKWEDLANRALRKLKMPSRFDSLSYPPHIKAAELRDALGKETFDSFFSFAIVRNPWDWQVSLYTYALKEVTHHQHELVRKLGSFDAYIRWRCAEEARFQKDFICSDDGELLVDFVARYERLDADFETICSRIGISASLPRLNVSNTKPYQLFYSEETRELVRRTFAADIALFGYDFGDMT
jgi:hypothetical protein